LSGCTITDISEVKPGMLGGDFQKLSDAYKKLDDIYKMSRVTKEKVPQKWMENETKLDLGATNIQLLPGPAAFQRIYSPTVFQGALADADNVEKLTNQAALFKAYFITYKNITTYTDRYYFSTKETIRQGDDLLIVIMFKKDDKTMEDMLFYADWQYVKIDTKESTSAFAQGIIEILKEYLGPASAVNDLYQKIQDQIKPSSSNP
jgi:hypothetical protein